MATAKINIFEYATRNNLRFHSDKGVITVEDLWKLDLCSLDKIYAYYSKEKRQINEEDSLLKSTAKVGDGVSPIDIKIDILKHIVSTKIAEDKAAAEAHDKAVKRQQIMELITNKENAELAGKSIEDLKKMLDEL